MTYRIRLVDEAKDLKVKLSKLKAFINNNKVYKTLTFKYRFYLNSQYLVMKIYYKILILRLKYIGKEK